MFHQHHTPVDVDDGHAADGLAPLSNLFILSSNDVAVPVGARGLGVDDIFEAVEGGEWLFEGMMIAATALELLREIDAGVLMSGGGVNGESIKVADGALGNHCDRIV